MVDGVLELRRDWDYDAVSVGVPAQVMAGRVVHEPVNLGEGWAGFDFEGPGAGKLFFCDATDVARCLTNGVKKTATHVAFGAANFFL